MAPKIWREKTHPGGGKHAKPAKFTQAGKLDTPELDERRDKVANYERQAREAGSNESPVAEPRQATPGQRR